MIGPFSRRQRARRQAAVWAVRRADGPSPQEAEFSAWLARHPSHPELYHAFDQTWRDPILTEAVTATRPFAAPRLRAAPFSAAALAAGFACLLLIVGLLGLSGVQRMVEPTLRFETSVGHTLSTRLADGSQIELNGDSALTVTIHDDRRSLVLERGQGYFDVAQDARRPLTIRAGDAVIDVVGTAFDLDITDNQVSLAVYRGRVDFYTRGDPLSRQAAGAGQRLHLAGAQIRRDADFDPNGGDWRNGWLETDDITLADLVLHMNRLSTQKIEIAEPRLRNLLVAGRLRIGEPDQLLNKLAGMHHFHVKQADGKLQLVL